MFVTRSSWSRLALTQPEIVDPKQGGRFNTTEIHCTEYHPAIRKGDLSARCSLKCFLPSSIGIEGTAGSFRSQTRQEAFWSRLFLFCTEHELLPFTATPALSIMMLNDFKTYLMETDVTKLTWAQYMEVDVAGNGTGLVDYWGNARPSWHSFRFWGDLPIERMVSHRSSACSL